MLLVRLQLDVAHVGSVIAVVPSQILDIVVVVLLVRIVVHESSMVRMNVGVPACAISIIMQSLARAAGSLSSCATSKVRSSEVSLRLPEGARFSSSSGEICASVPSIIEMNVCVSAGSVSVVDAGLSGLAQYSSHVRFRNNFYYSLVRAIYFISSKS